MKNKFLFPVILIAVLLAVNFSVCQVYSQTPQNKPAKLQTIKYTCPMHPEIIKDHPGNCPICGMKLVEKKDNPNGDMHKVNDSIMRKGPMMHDTTTRKKVHMMNDTTYMKQDHLEK